jgi:serine/threonine protein kinase/tetratricopeptide (TPR) repeat protein
LEISAADWATLSPLVDEALDLSPKARIAWLNESATVRALAAVQREQLQQLIKESDAPETDELLATLPQFALKAHHYVDSFKACDAVGPYQLIEKVGVGGMSEVWRARRVDGAYEREVALKLPYAHASVASREHFIRRMERERDLLARLEHPNIARFYDAGIAKTALGAQPYLALEFVEGETLVDYANNRCLTIEARCRLFLQVLSAVQYAHQRFVVHRDLKPSNILVRNDGQVALLDFGIAKVLDEETQIGNATMLTREMGRAITLAYASPEQLLSEPITTASDVYSAGVLFYELLCGKRPFAGHDHSMMSLLGVLDTPPPSPTWVVKSDTAIDASKFGLGTAHSLAKALRGDPAAIAAKAVRRSPTDRYESAAAFGLDIDRYLRDEPVMATQGAYWYTLAKFAKRQQKALLVAAVGLIAVAAVGAGAYRQYEQANLSAARAQSADGLLSGLLGAVSPENASTKSFTAKEILDRSLKELARGAENGQEPLYFFRLAELYQQIGELDTAANLFEVELRRVEKKGDEDASARALIQLAVIATARTKADESHQYLDRAARSLKRFAKDDEQTIKLHIERARAFYEQRRFDESVQELLVAERKLSGLSLQPKRLLAEQRELMGHVAFQRSDLDYARAMYAEAADIDLSSEGRGEIAQLVGRLHIISLDVQRGAFSSAKQLAEQVLPLLKSRFSDQSSHVISCESLYARALLLTGELDKAEEIAKRVEASAKINKLTDYIDSAKVTRLSAAMYRDRGIDIQRELIELISSFAGGTVNPRQEVVRRLLAEDLLRNGKTEDALTVLRVNEERIRSLVGSQHIQAAPTQVLLAIALLRTGQLDAAEGMLSSARSIVLAKRGKDHPVALSAEIYLALIPLLRTKQVTLPPESLLRSFAWQMGTQKLSTWFSSIEVRESLATLPLVF